MSDLISEGNNQKPEQEQAQQPQQEAAPQEQQQQAQPESFLTWGEREFKTQEDVIKKFEHADTFIEQQKSELEKLKEEKARLEAELQQSKKLEDAMQELQTSQTQEPKQGEHTAQPEAQAPQFDEDALLSKFEERQRQQQIEAQQKQNLEQIHEQAKARFGDSYLDKLVSKAKEDGLDYDSKDELVQLAKTKPKTFSKLFGLSDTRKPSPAPQSGMNVSAEPNKSESKSWSDMAQEIAGKYGVDYGKGFHSVR